MELTHLINKQIIVRVKDDFDSKAKILSGRVYEVYHDKIRIQLSKSYRGGKFRSNKMELTPRYQGEDIFTFIRKKELTIGGALLKKDSEEVDYVLIGTIKL